MSFSADAKKENEQYVSTLTVFGEHIELDAGPTIAFSHILIHFAWEDHVEFATLITSYSMDRYQDSLTQVSLRC